MSERERKRERERERERERKWRSSIVNYTEEANSIKYSLNNVSSDTIVESLNYFVQSQHYGYDPDFIDSLEKGS